jgi:hypothetical protein
MILGKQLVSSTKTVYNKTVRSIETTNKQTIAKAKLIMMIIILILPPFAKHLYFPKYIL